MALGLIAVYSASFALGALAFNDANYFVIRQAIWAAIGIALRPWEDALEEFLRGRQDDALTS